MVSHICVAVFVDNIRFHILFTRNYWDINKITSFCCVKFIVNLIICEDSQSDSSSVRLIEFEFTHNHNNKHSQPNKTEEDIFWKQKWHTLKYYIRHNNHTKKRQKTLTLRAPRLLSLAAWNTNILWSSALSSILFDVLCVCFRYFV